MKKPKGKPKRWVWRGWLLPRGEQFTSRSTAVPCLYAGDEGQVAELASEMGTDDPVEVRVTITPLRQGRRAS